MWPEGIAGRRQRFGGVKPHPDPQSGCTNLTQYVDATREMGGACKRGPGTMEASRPVGLFPALSERVPRQSGPGTSRRTRMFPGSGGTAGDLTGLAFPVNEHHEIDREKSCPVKFGVPVRPGRTISLSGCLVSIPHAALLQFIRVFHLVKPIFVDVP